MFPRLLAVLLLFVTLGCSSPARRPPPAVSVLFIGNSYTYGNDLPDLLAQVLAGQGTALTHQSITVGGATLEKHLATGEAVQAITARPWDYVVLQEQSARPIRDRAAMFNAARTLHAAIHASGATTLLYETWAAKAVPHEQAALTDAYRTLATDLGAILVPVGEAWERALSEGATLHGSDGRHPNLRGSYLAACVFARVLGTSDALTLPTTIVRAEKSLVIADAAALQRCANATVDANAATIR